MSIARPGGLTRRQAKFVEEYLIDFNATQAAVRAGYSAKTARVIGGENLLKPALQLAIQERQKQLSVESGVTPEMIVKELTRVGFFDVRKMFDKQGELKNIVDMDIDTAACISAVETTQGRAGTTRKIRFADKLKALDLLARHFGLLNSDKSGGVGDAVGRLVDEVSAARARITALRQKR